MALLRTNIAAYDLSLVLDKTIFLTCCTFANRKILCKFALEHFISEFMFEFVKIKNVLLCKVLIIIPLEG